MTTLLKSAYTPKTCTACDKRAGSWAQFERLPPGKGICAQCAKAIFDDAPKDMEAFGVAGINWDGSKIGHTIVPSSATAHEDRLQIFRKLVLYGRPPRTSLNSEGSI